MDAIDVTGLDGGLVALSEQQLGALASRVQGPLLRAGDNGWDEAVLVWNGMVAKVPALVLRPTSAADVAEAVRFAAERRLLLAIKGGGHNIAGTAMAPGGLTLDMSLMRDVTVDLATRQVHVVPGCKLTMRLAPPAPFLPPEWHGKPIVGIVACHTGADAPISPPSATSGRRSSTSSSRSPTPPSRRCWTPPSPRGRTTTGRRSSSPASPTDSSRASGPARSRSPRPCRSRSCSTWPEP